MTAFWTVRRQIGMYEKREGWQERRRASVKGSLSLTATRARSRGETRVNRLWTSILDRGGCDCRPPGLIKTSCLGASRRARKSLYSQTAPRTLCPANKSSVQSHSPLFSSPCDLLFVNNLSYPPTNAGVSQPQTATVSRSQESVNRGRNRGINRGKYRSI